ncbi:MAG: hypothetical protein AAF694_06135 [Bacteroidota bacterium]
MNTESSIDPQAFLLFGLQHFQLTVQKVEENKVFLLYGYEIEIEGPSLYKLTQEGLVIAPFSDVEDLCRFIAQDPVWNHG